MRNIKFISLIAFILLVVGIIGSAFTFRSFYQADWIVKEDTIAGGSIEQLDIHTNNTKIEVLPTNDTDITAELSTKSKKYELITEVNDDTYFVQVKDKRRNFISLDFFSFGTGLTVYVPEKIYNSLQVVSDNGLISVGQIQANDLHVKADNGKIELKDIESTVMTGKASNWSITMKDINSSTVDVNKSNGKIRLDHVDGDVYGKTNNGEIEFITENLDRSIELETDNGKIDIQTKQEPTNVTFDVRVDNGKISILGSSNWDTIIGNGENLIKLKTNNGSINVTK